MKCPKCHYLGFETGDRCKNCGYDFSLAAAPRPEPAVDVDLTLYRVEQDCTATAGWLDSIDLRLSDEPAPVPPEPTIMPASTPAPTPAPEPAAASASSQPAAPTPANASTAASTRAPSSTPTPVPAQAPASSPAHAIDAKPAAPSSSQVMSSASASAPRVVSAVEPALPLFAPEGDPDEPLIKLPPAPRPPLAVRKTPDRARLRAVPRPAPRPREPEPVLAFDEEKTPEPARPPVVAARAAAEDPAAAPGARLAAAAIDNAVLFGVDAVVVYLTARMTGLPAGEWTALPLAPLVAFLILLKAGYFCAFTAVGGQTIGKMALRLRVVTLDGEPVDGVAAFQRTVIGTISAVPFGLGFLPALLAPDRRGLHDRLTGTRVVSQNFRPSQRAGDVARA